MMYKKGDTIHCENGHLICTIGRDLKIGELGWATAFVDWQQKAPGIGDSVQWDGSSTNENNEPLYVGNMGYPILFCDICRGAIYLNPKKQKQSNKENTK